MRWSETVASHCRYSDIAERIWGEWDILWENSTDDYQGNATFLAHKDGRYSFYEYYYGSCSGCDGWESDESSADEIANEMHDTALWFASKEELLVYLNKTDGKKALYADKAAMLKAVA